MTSGDDSYPSSWTPRRAASQIAPSAEPSEAVALAVDSYVAALSNDDFAALIARTRG